MRIYTGRSPLLEGALLKVLREGMNTPAEVHLVVVPKQLTLQTERTLLKALALPGSFDVQVTSPERLCGRIFEAAGLPEGVRVDERGRVMLVRAAVRSVREKLRLYRDAEQRRGFADRCARQLELIRQAGLTPEKLSACAGAAEGMLALKLSDLSVILEAYEALIEGRYQDGESEFNHAVARAGDAAFLRRADVYFYGFDLTPPTLHRLMVAVGAACREASVFLPLENDPEARDFDAFLPLQAGFERLWAAAKAAGAPVERVLVEPEGPASPRRLVVEAPGQHPELERLSRELFAFPARRDNSGRVPSRVQLAQLRNPTEECRFAAALCRRLVMRRRWRWRDVLILCRDLEAYHQPLQEAFRAYGVPLFLSSSRAASRHALAECLLSALRLIDESPQPEDAMALLRTGYMPLTADEADRLSNFAVKYGLRARMLLRPLRRGGEAERQALEPLRERFAAPINALRERMRRAKDLPGQLAALFTFLTDIGAPEKLQARLNALIEGGLREQAGEESQVWNRLVGALDQMAALMGEAPMSASELRQTLSDSLEAAVIKPLPQSDDAVFAQTTERITAQPARAILILGETDRSGADADGLLNAAQLEAFSRMTRAYLGSDDAELSRMRRFYLKSAIGMATDYLCVTCPMSGADNAAQHPGALVGLIRDLFPGLRVRGGLSEDSALERMLRGAPAAAATYAARALSALNEGAPMADYDRASLAALRQLSGERGEPGEALGHMATALRHGESADRLDPATARALYGALRRQSVSRLEKFADCPFAYFVQYGLRPEKLEPYALTVQDEGTFFHDAVHEFLLASMEDLNALAVEAAEARMDAIAERLLEGLSEGPMGDTAVALAERRRLKATARVCAAVLAEHMRGSRFSPAALETAFGVEDGPARLIVNAASGECTLEGRIDRVDEWPEGGYLRVIDYKRGGRELQLDAVYHGLSLQLPVYLAAALRQRRERSAGVYYFALDEGIFATQSTDPHEVEKARRDSFRLSGLAPDDRDLLRALSPDFESVMKVRINRDGSLAKGTLATDEHGFEALIAHAMKKAGEHLDGIRGGDAAVSPARHRQKNPCDWCDWRSVCLLDERMDASCLRRFRTLRAEAVMERLKLEQ